MDVHLRDLRYFLAVAEELHFTRAAARLYVSQPALSKQIRALERQLGHELLTRGPRAVSLTAAGRLLATHVQGVLGEWDSTAAALDALAAGRAARLVIGMSTGPGRAGLLPAIRSRFADVQPGVRLELRQIGWADSTAGLADRSTDAAFVWLPMAEPARYRWLVVAEEPRVVAMVETHRLAAADVVEVADLLDEPLLALPEAAGPVRDHWLLGDHRAGTPAPIGAIVHSADETYEALLDGRGVVVLAAGNAPLLTRGGVVIRALRGVGASRLALAWRADDPRPMTAAYVRAAEQVVRSRSEPGTSPPR